MRRSICWLVIREPFPAFVQRTQTPLDLKLILQSPKAIPGVCGARNRCSCQKTAPIFSTLRKIDVTVYARAENCTSVPLAECFCRANIFNQPRAQPRIRGYEDTAVRFTGESCMRASSSDNVTDHPPSRPRCRL